MNIVIPLMYMSISLTFFFMARRISLLRYFVVDEKKGDRLKYLMYLNITFGVFELYIGANALIYYNYSLNQIEALHYLDPFAIIFLYVIASLILKMTNRNSKNIFYDVVSIPLVFISSLLMFLSFNIDLARVLITTFIIITSIAIFIPFTYDMMQQVQNIRKNDPIEKARGIGAILTIVAGIFSSLFFIINRVIGHLFGLFAVAAQISLLLTAYGLYVNLAPPNFLIKIVSRGKLR